MKRLTSFFNRRTFLQDCREEEVISTSIQKLLKNNEHPCSDAARTCLEEKCQKISNKIYDLFDMKKNVELTHALTRRLEAINKEQTENLQQSYSHSVRTAHGRRQEEQL